MTHSSLAFDSQSYKPVYRLGGIAAFLAALFLLGEVVALALFPPPSTLEGWFQLLEDKPLIGLMDLWLLEIPMYLAFVPLFLALYLWLRQASRGLMLVSLTLALLGVAVFLATNNPFNMLSLSRRYAASSAQAERSSLVSAGEALLANTGQRAVGGFNMGLLLVSVAGMIASIAMLQDAAFQGSIAWVGILAHALSLADYLRQALTSSPMITLLIVLPNALLLVTWYVMAGRRLHRLGNP